MLSGKVQILETDFSSGKECFAILVAACSVGVCDCTVLTEYWIINTSCVLMIHTNDSTPVYFISGTYLISLPVPKSSVIINYLVNLGPIDLKSTEICICNATIFSLSYPCKFLLMSDFLLLYPMGFDTTNHFHASYIVTLL